MTPTRPDRGYVLLTVLLLVGLIVTTAATYAHHMTVSYRHSSASLSIQESRESAQSGLAVASQLLATGSSTYDSVIASGTQDIVLAMDDLGGNLRQVRVEALSQGLGTTLDGRATVSGALEGAVPQLTSVAAGLAKNDPAQLKISGTQVLADTVVSGTLILARGSKCTLRDVVVNGSIVSEPSITGPPYLAGQTVTLTIDGTLRVDGNTVLPGCAIIMPDGALTTLSTSALEIHGVVLAQSINWQGSGAADQHIMAGQAFTLPSSFDRPGYGRTPPAWPASLQLNALGMSRLSFPPAVPSSVETQAIKRFSFPQS